MPEIACNCSVCTSDHPHNKRLRTSSWLHHDGFSVLFDCSPDFRQQALIHQIKLVDALVLTHGHFDHIAGMDDLRSFNRFSGRIPVFVPHSERESLYKSFYYLFEPPTQVGGGVSDIELMPLWPDQPFAVKGVRFEPLLVFHGQIPILGYTTGNFAYITDAKTMPDATIKKIKGVEILILNSLRYREHKTHLNLAQTLDIIEQVKPEKTWIVHTTHNFDYETVSAMLPDGVELAYDGLSIEVELK